MVDAVQSEGLGASESAPAAHPETVPGATGVRSPRSQGRAIGLSIGSQLAAKVVHLVLNVVSTLAILRYLAPERYGSFVLVVTLVALVSVLADFGLPKLAVREVSRAANDRNQAQNEILGTVVLMRLGLTVVAMGAAQLMLLALSEPLIVHQAAAIASLVLIFDAVLGAVVVSFQVELVQQYEAFVRVVAEGLETALVLCLIAWQVSFLWLFAPPLVGIAVGTGLAVAVARHRCGLRMRVTPVRIRHLATEALPIGLALLIAALFLKLDSLIVAALRPAADLGIYAAAYQPIEYLFLAAAVVINVLFPLLARAWGSGDLPRFAEVYQRGSELLLMASIFVPLALAFVAPQVVALAFGDAYADAAQPLRILALALVPLTLTAWLSLALLAGGQQRVTLAINAVGLVVALLLCTCLVLLVGITGAALSVLLSSSLLLAVALRAARRRLGIRIAWGQVLRILLLTAATAAAVAGLAWLDLPWYVLLLAAGLFYAVGVCGFGFARSLQRAFA